MTSKERIKAALEFKPVDRVPAAILDGGVWIADRAGYSFDELTALDDGGAQILFDAYNEMQSDLIFTGGGCFGMALRAIGCEGKFSEKGKSAETKPMTDDPEYFKDFDVSTIREKLLNDPGIQGVLRQTKRLRELAGDEKYVTTIVGAPFSYAGQLVGVQNLMLSLYDEDVDLQPLYEVGAALCVEFTNLLIEAGAEIVGIGDPVASGALISQALFEEHALPLLKRALSQIKGAEKIILHICGNTTPRLESLKEIGIDAFSLDTVDLKTALDAANGHYAVFGNLSPFDVMVSMSAEEIKELSRERCQLAGKNGGFILAPGCDLPNATPIENVLAMTAGAIEA